jgi:hypothetical protein
MEFTHHCQVCNKEFYLAKGFEAHIRKHLVVGESNTLHGAKQSNTENIYCTSFQSPKASGSFKVDKIISLEGTPHNKFNLNETNSVLQQESLSMKQKQQFQSGMMTLENNSVQSSSQTMNSFQMPLNDSMDITTEIPANPSQMPDSIIPAPNSLSSIADIPYKTVDIRFHTSTKSVQFPTYPSQMANSIIKTPTIPIPNSSHSQLGNNSWQTSEGFSEIKTQRTGHFKCHLCYYYSDRYSNMLLHIANVHYKKEVMTAIEKCQDLACHLCEYKAAIFNSLTNHLIKRHNILDTLIPPKGDLVSKNVGSDYFYCHICTFSTRSYMSLLLHMASQHFKDKMKRINPQSSNVNCSLCSHSLAQPRYLTSHLLTVHRVLDKFLPSKVELRKPNGNFIKKDKKKKKKKKQLQRNVQSNLC